MKALGSIAAAAALTLASPAAADVYCGGDAPVLKILTYRDGAVLIKTAWRGDFMQICNLTTAWKNVSTSTCFAWMSQIAGAISAGKRTGFWFDSSQSNFCATAPTYGNALPPFYVDVAQ